MPAGIAIVTNARAADQRSMLGYGKLLLEVAHSVDPTAIELPALSVLSDRLPTILATGRTGKLVRDFERYVLTPASLAGRRARICHVVDPGNAPYLDVIRHRVSIVTVHDLIPYLCLAGRLKGFRPSFTGRWLMRLIVTRLKRTDRIVCVSECTRRDLLELTEVDPSSVVVIPNAVFQPIAAASQEECAALRAELGLRGDAEIILHVGRNFYKNRETVLEVFARIRAARTNVCLLLVGNLTPELEDQVAKLNVEANVHVVSYISPARMAALYTTSALLLFPSLYEGFGYPVLEAQMCGTPVVCSDGGSLVEVAGDGALVFAPHDVEGMAIAVLELLDDPKARTELGSRGHNNTRRFTRADWLSAHSALYNALA